MTLPDQLRAIADRLEAANLERDAALNEVARVGHYVTTVLGASPDSAAVQVAAGAGAEGGGAVATAPSARFGPSTSRREAKRTGQDGMHQGSAPTAEGPTRCPRCDKDLPTPRGLNIHLALAHGVKSQSPGHGASKRVTAGARLAARDASRSAPPSRVSIAPAKGVTRPAVVAPAPVLRHGTETFLCSRCPESFLTREDLETHLLLKHPDTTPRRLPVGQGPPRDGYQAAERVLRGGA